MRDLAAQVTSSLLCFPKVTVDALGEDEITLDSVLRGKFTFGKSTCVCMAAIAHQLERIEVWHSHQLGLYCRHPQFPNFTTTKKTFGFPVYVLAITFCLSASSLTCSPLPWRRSQRAGLAGMWAPAGGGPCGDGRASVRLLL